MKKVKITKHMFDHYKPNLHDGVESFRLHNDYEMIKFIKKKYLTQDREHNTEQLETLQLDNLVIPNYMIYDQNKYIGYSMRLIKDYIYIYDLITNNLDNEKISFQERKKLMIELSNIIEYLNKLNFSYFDIHNYNILVSNNKLNLIDLDGGLFKGYRNNEFDYETAIRFETKQLSRFTLSFIYNLKIENFLILVINNKEIFKYLPKDLKDFYSYVINNNFKVYEGISELLDSINEEIYLDTKEIIKKKI